MEKKVRNHWLTVRLNDEEFERLGKLQDKTVGNNLSDYVRKVVLSKPVNVKYRNISIDDFLRDMLQLKKDLNGIANNFNQAVHKLHTLDRLPEFRSWVQQNEEHKTLIFEKIAEILSRVTQLHNLWLQS